MKMFVPVSAALLLAGPAAAQPSHEAHHPAGKAPTAAMSDEKACPKMEETSANMQQMKQMHEQMMGQMAQMMQMMQTMQQQHQGMGMSSGMGPGMGPGTTTPKTPPPSDAKPH